MYTKASEVTAEVACNYIKEDYASMSEPDKTFIETAINISKEYISTRTGLAVTSTDTAVKTVDSYPEMVFAVLVMVKEMWDNGNLYVDSNNINRVVDSCIESHRVNFL